MKVRGATLSKLIAPTGKGALEALGIDRDITLVIHDWGSALGFDFAATFPERVKRVCYMEAIVQPIPSWVDWPDSARNLFQVFRSDDGETAIIDNNVFVERVLPGSVIRKLTDAEMEVYRKPFLKPEDRWPTLDWPREIPIANVPANVTAIAANYAQSHGKQSDTQAIHQRRSGCHSDRSTARILPHLAQSNRTHGQGLALHPGG